MIPAILILIAVIAVSSRVVTVPSRPPPHPLLDPYPQVKGHSLTMLQEVFRSGGSPSHNLVRAAMVDAWNAGHMSLVHAIASAYQTQVRRASLPPMPPMPPTPVEEVPPVSTDEKVAGTTSYKSPIDHLDDSHWSEFVDALKVTPVDFSEDKHVGQFRHHRARLTQLGIADVEKDADKQYQALVADINDHWKNHRDMLDTFAARTVDVGGEKTCLTASGILGLLKAAGPKNAVRWIENDGDRSRSPHTTDVFLRVNGIF